MHNLDIVRICGIITQSRRLTMIDTNTKSKEIEQRDLSVLLLQKLVQINTTMDLRIWDKLWNKIDEHVVYAGLKDDYCDSLYAVYHKLRTDKFYLQINLPKGLVRLGDTDADGFGWPNINKGVFFTNEKRNYLSAFYFLIWTENFKNIGLVEEHTVKAKQAIQHLMSQKPNPNLKSAAAWSSDRMALFPYLDSFLSKTK